MADPLELAFRRACAALLPPGIPVLAAVSGGADSVALLHLLVRARPGAAPPVVAHLDHAMRRGSAADRRFVEALARRLGLECRSDRRPVPERRRRGESPEEAARRVRREFLSETAARSGAGRVALAHTLDDQAETVLLRLVRGGGPGAVSGIDPAGPLPFVRPLLGIERAALRRWLARRRLPFREDPSNRDLRFDRNRLRLRVLPLLAEALNPAAARHLAAAADRIRDDAAYLDALADELHSRIARGGRLDAAALAGAPPVLARRAARRALQAAGADPRRIGTAHLEALLDLAAGPAGRSRDLPGVRAVRTGRGLVLEARR